MRRTSPIRAESATQIELTIKQMICAVEFFRGSFLKLSFRVTDNRHYYTL